MLTDWIRFAAFDDAKDTKLNLGPEITNNVAASERVMCNPSQCFRYSAID